MLTAYKPKVKYEAKKHDLPAFTCGSIDKVQAKLNEVQRDVLEQLRTDNENLREASEKYYRDNKEMAETMNQLQQERDIVFADNEKLQVKKDWLADIASGVVSVDAVKVIELTQEVDRLKNFEVYLEEIYSAGINASSASRMSSRLSVDCRTWMSKTAKARKDRNNTIRKNALDKLTSEELTVLKLSRVDEDEEEAEDDDE